MIPESEDLPDARSLHRLRTMALCKNMLDHSESILNCYISCSSDSLSVIVNRTGFFMPQKAKLYFYIRREKKNE